MYLKSSSAYQNYTIVCLFILKIEASSFVMLDSEKEEQNDPRAVGRRGKKKTWAHRCGSKTAIRRLVRILYLVGIIIVIILIPFTVVFNLFASQTFEIDSSSKIIIAQESCKLYIQEDSSLQVGKISVKIETPGKFNYLY